VAEVRYVWIECHPDGNGWVHDPKEGDRRGIEHSLQSPAEVAHAVGDRIDLAPGWRIAVRGRGGRGAVYEATKGDDRA